MHVPLYHKGESVILKNMPKKHRPKRGVVRASGNEIYFAYAVLVALCLVLVLYLILGDDTAQEENVQPDRATTETDLQVEPPTGEQHGNPQEALNQSLQSSDDGQGALQGSLNSQSSSVGSDQLQPSTGKEEYEAYDN